MSLMVTEATGDPRVRTLARDIILTQQQQLGQMYGWLVMWGEDQVGAAPPMTWMKQDMDEMGHGSAQMAPAPGGRMPGCVRNGSTSSCDPSP